jgi:hypothetical protein
MQKTVTLPQFLTEAQINEAVRLYQAHGTHAVAQIQALVIEPNMAAINEKLGQENHPRYLAYAVLHVLTQTVRAS